MKNTVFEITFLPVAISIFCGILLAVNSVAPMMHAWPVWGLFMLSTLLAFLAIASSLTVGLVQWIMQYMNRKAL